MVEIEVEFNWDRTGINKDWSVTAWGDKGGVSVNHLNGIESDSLPYVPKGSRSWESSRIGTSSPIRRAVPKAKAKEAEPDFWGGGYDFGIDLSSILSSTFGQEEKKPAKPKKKPMTENQAMAAKEVGEIFSFALAEPVREEKKTPPRPEEPKVEVNYDYVHDEAEVAAMSLGEKAYVRMLAAEKEAIDD